MLVKTFQAGEMSEALRMVKAEMGLDAMILSSKKERRKGILGYFTKPYFEVTAALDPRPQPRLNPYREEPAPQPRERELSTREEFQNSMLGPLAREVRELKLKVEALSKQQPARAEGEAAGRSFGKDELEEIKKLLYSAVAGNGAALPVAAASPQAAAEQAKGSPVPRTVTFPLANGGKPQSQPQSQPLSQAAPLQGAVEALLGTRLQRPTPEQAQLAGDPLSLELLAEELEAEEIGAEAAGILLDKLRPAAEAGAGVPELRRLLADAVASTVKCTGSLRMKRNGSRILAVVGPTGVGKTTTIAKLAALHALNRRVSVALITTDNFRVGAVEQLKTYAKIMDLPLEVVASSEELAAALAAHADKDLVLIDTAGRSPKDSERIDELKGFLECYPGIETCLCLSATTRARELDEIVAVFGTIPISRMLFTKLDESESYGCIVEAHLKHKLPLSYFTTGQKVPEDIEVATSKKLASLVVKESAQ